MKKSGKYRLSAIVALVFMALSSPAQTLSKYIVIDQFGYLPSSRKIAVIRDPQVGYDAAESFSPGATYALVKKSTGEKIFSSTITKWKNGNTDVSSGDKAWWFDFSSVTVAGTYYILDIDKDVKSFDFDISTTVYNNVLKHAVRMFFYQRAGCEKSVQYAGPEWADGASHLGPGQDKNARQYNQTTNASKERNLMGGWFDAGDFHRYTNWTAAYVLDFMRAYIETPSVWADNYNIPESGNGIPDLLDEAKWAIDHLLRMQQSDGSVLSILSVDSNSPPSAAKGKSVYGTASTSATLSTGAAYAAASKVYRSIGMDAYADTLKARALKAWTWAGAHPSVIFMNNVEGTPTWHIGGGQQETDNYGRFMSKMKLACFLFEITGDTLYKTYIETNYKSVAMFNYLSLFNLKDQEMLLYYATLPGATASVASEINAAYKNGMNTSSEQFKSYTDNIDPYTAPIGFYGWGTNSIKAMQGLMFADVIVYNIDPSKNDLAIKAAEGYIHYIHGLNPLNLVYLSNMYKYGGENCVNEFYHAWFTNGSPKWDRVGVSLYGPPPGFLTGGANPGYNWDACCPNNCGGGNATCTAESIKPPTGQPNQKSYKDFNTSWPLNSWEVTENSCAYQINYVRLLSKFISVNADCNGDINGTAAYDLCNRCTGGNTGLTPVTDPAKCSAVTEITDEKSGGIQVYPNPTKGTVHVQNDEKVTYQVTITNLLGKKILTGNSDNETQEYSIDNQADGLYLVTIHAKGYSKTFKILKK